MMLNNYNLRTVFEKYLILFLLNIFIIDNSFVYGLIPVPIKPINPGNKGENGGDKGSYTTVITLVFVMLALLLIILLALCWYKKHKNNRLIAPAPTITTENVKDVRIV
ncbi:hypothetical protein C1645_822852 [Glomus cerebriforme]|uniref:Uncharacterized protein n=1 Tax=Glomus cerebriforme TaxID=658196 RepID=A0A397SYW5_9GLOM|nr:hypothetical protein C1645_822852 [Glomus cerebriforme]